MHRCGGRRINKREHFVGAPRLRRRGVTIKKKSESIAQRPSASRAAAVGETGAGRSILPWARKRHDSRSFNNRAVWPPPKARRRRHLGSLRAYAAAASLSPIAFTPFTGPPIFVLLLPPNDADTLMHPPFHATPFPQALYESFLLSCLVHTFLFVRLLSLFLPWLHESSGVCSGSYVASQPCTSK